LRALLWFLRASLAVLAVPAVPCAVSSPHSRRANAAAQSIHLIASLWCFLGYRSRHPSGALPGPRLLCAFPSPTRRLCGPLSAVVAFDTFDFETACLPACLPAKRLSLCRRLPSTESAAFLPSSCTRRDMPLYIHPVLRRGDMTAVRRLGRRALAPSHADRLHELHHQHQRQTQPHFAPTATRPYPLFSLTPYPSLTSPTVAAP
jgi:hypothetical protein